MARSIDSRGAGLETEKPRSAGDKFGSSVDVSGDWIIVGSPIDGSSQGSAYVFKKPTNGWVTDTQTLKLTASDGAASDLFGTDVAIIGGGLGGTPTAVVGADGDDSSKGAAYVFRYNATTWSQAGKLTAGDRANSDKLGFSVAMDGDTIIAGAYGDDSSKGSVYVFVEPASGWTTMTQHTAKITAGDAIASDYFGYGVSIHRDTIIIGAPWEESTGTNRGSAYVYHRPAGGWATTSTHAYKLAASDASDNDEFGRTVAVSGDHAIVSSVLDDDGGSASGAAYAYGGVSPCDTQGFTYDEDGNLIDDDVNTYEWDAENRLIAVYPSAPSDGDAKLAFKYDYRSRRVQKEVYEWDGSLNGGAGGWEATPVTRIRFVYDNWNVLLELDGLDSNAVLKKYTWGLDVTGQSGDASTSGLHGAGGISGLLAVHDVGESDDYGYFYDANGNVGQMIDVSTATLASDYEYDAYGNTVLASGAYADANAYRFSTKCIDTEVHFTDSATEGIYYYGYRYYSSDSGRWLSRDPKFDQDDYLTFDAPERLSAEGMAIMDPVFLASSLSDETQLFAYTRNDPINGFDADGLEAKSYIEVIAVAPWKDLGCGGFIARWKFKTPKKLPCKKPILIQKVTINASCKKCCKPGKEPTSQPTSQPAPQPFIYYEVLKPGYVDTAGWKRLEQWEGAYETRGEIRLFCREDEEVGESVRQWPRNVSYRLKDCGNFPQTGGVLNTWTGDGAPSWWDTKQKGSSASRWAKSSWRCCGKPQKKKTAPDWTWQVDGGPQVTESKGFE